ncbi:MAG: hypothetical protein EOP05_19215 [Proteobacteria bacterium]|nr:MAG: hypothetical protein EOP05_19215 [Pseudomonadota bacterium]
MKRVVVVLMLALGFAGISGCQKAKNSTRVSTGSNVRSGGIAPGSTTTPSGIQLTKEANVTTTDSQESFQLGVGDLLEGQVARDYVGAVSRSASDGTGVFIGGKVELENGQRIGVSNGVVSVAANSELLIAVYDSYYTQQGLDPIPPIYLKKASGMVNGNSADITFSDAYGTIRLFGQFNNQTFEGTFSYDTLRTFDGKKGWNGTLGRFKIPTCSIFRCQ